MDGDTNALQRLDIGTRKHGPVLKLPETFLVSCLASTPSHLILGAKDSGQFLSIKVVDICQLPNPEFLNGRTGSVLSFEPPPYDLVEFGTQHQNFCSLARLPTCVGLPDTIVAVIANNDCNVCIHSITYSRPLVTLNFPFPINNATFSPNGKYVILVGDSERAYVYQYTAASATTINESSKPIWQLSPAERALRWQKLRELDLYKHPAVRTEAYFATAWSDDARYCATASESGYITLLDVSKLEDLDADPILITVPSSRPSLLGLGGPVRSMTFLPAKFDLLLWVEDSGKAYLGDLRDGLATRQVLDLEWRAVVAENDDLGSSTASDVDFIHLSPRQTHSEDAIEYNMQRSDDDIAIGQRQAPTVGNPALLALANALAAGMGTTENRNDPADLNVGTDVPALPPWEIAHPDYDDTRQHEPLAYNAANDFLPPRPAQPQLEAEFVQTITDPRENPVVALPPVPRAAIASLGNPLPGALIPPARSDDFVVGSPPVTTPRFQTYLQAWRSPIERQRERQQPADRLVVAGEPEAPLQDATLTAQQRFEAEFPQGSQIHIPRLTDADARPEQGDLPGDGRLDPRHVPTQLVRPPRWDMYALPDDWPPHDRPEPGVRTTRNEVPNRDRSTGKLHTTGNVVSADGRTM